MRGCLRPCLVMNLFAALLLGGGVEPTNTTPSKPQSTAEAPNGSRSAEPHIAAPMEASGRILLAA